MKGATTASAATTATTVKTVFAVLAVFAVFAPPAQAVPLTLVVDPAHGGEDAGAVAQNGFREKDLTLPWAFALRDRCAQEPEWSVILLREQDTTLTPDQRAAKANQVGGHLLVSFHVNQAPVASLKGMGLRLYKPAGSPRRNSPSGAPGAAGSGSGRGGSSSPVWWSQAQTSFMMKSRLLASECLESLSRVEPTAVKEGPWADLGSFALPAVALELGYLSEPGDAERLRQPEWRARVIEALVEAIRNFRNRVER